MTQPNLENMNTTACEICTLALKVDQYIVPKIIPTRQRIPIKQTEIKLKGEPGFRIIVVAGLQQAVHFDCLLAVRLHDAGLIERVPDAGTPDPSSTETIPAVDPSANGSTSSADDKLD